MTFCYPPEVYLRSGLRPKRSPNDLGRAMLQAIAEGELEEVHEHLDHYHGPQLYGRRMTTPAGTVFVTKIHKSRHFTIALAGHCTVVDQDGNAMDVQAPDVWITEPGTQRSVMCHTEVQWMTVHSVPDGLTDILALEALLVDDPFIEDRRRLAPADQEK